jgi:nitrous oxidase accessory protein NosD
MLFCYEIKVLLVPLVGDRTETLIPLLILSFVLASIPQIGVVKAENIVYIHSDGSIEGTDKIVKQGNVRFVFLDNVTGKSIVVQRLNSIIDGAGFTLQGSGNGTGIKLLRGGTLQNINVDYYSVGVSAEGDNMATVSGCNITHNDVGITYSRSFYPIYDSIITGNNITGNVIGIKITMGNEGEKTNMLVVGNHIANNDYALRFQLSQKGLVFNPYSMDVRIYRNNFVNNNHTASYGTYEIPNFPVYVNDYRNIWSSYWEKGNYWSDYNGTDFDGDGIGDKAYHVDMYNYDSYPLMNPVETQIIPEFPSWSILLLFLLATSSVLVFRKKLFHQRS